jgi:hypothetical protein
VSDAAERASPPSRGAPPSSQTVPVSYRGEMAPMIHERLVKALGGKRAAEIMREGIAELGGRTLETPQDMMDFADVLVRSTGLIQAVGRSIKVMALLRGASER